MKTQITKVVAAIALLAIGASLNAGTGKSGANVSIATENSKAVVLQLKDISAGTAISIKDQAGIILFQDEANAAAYTKVFNLNNLDEGQLSLEIESDEQLEVLSIQVTDTEAYLEKSQKILIEKPVLKVKEEMAKVFFGQNEGDTKVTIFDKHGDIAYRHKAKNGAALTYDLSSLASGEYKFQFKSGGRTFYQSVEVK